MADFLIKTIKSLSGETGRALAATSLTLTYKKIIGRKRTLGHIAEGVHLSLCIL